MALPNYLREFFLSRIIAGYLVYNQNGHWLKICSPTSDLMYEANLIYCDCYNKCLDAGIMDEVGVMEILHLNGLWTEENEKEYEYLPKHMEVWKEKIYESFGRKSECDRNRKYLKFVEKEYEKLFSIRSQFNYASCDGISSYAKHQFLVERSTFTKSGKRYNWSALSPHQLLSYYQSNIIFESTLRELSHNSPWDNIWQAGKKSKSLFDKPATELSSEQIRLICWSGMYDNIHENSDCPSDEIVNDNDALDGWLIIQRKEREQRKFEKKTENRISDKINNADEIYIMTEGDTLADKMEEAKKIDQMNSAYAKMIKKQRFSIIDAKGQVNEAALPDVKQDLQIQLNNYGNKRKGM